jgi:CheY-like chemotaxis protein
MSEIIGTCVGAARLRVLLADDEMHILDILSTHLERSGFEVLVANNGIDALEMIQTQLPAIIVLDEQMPGLRGSEICQRLALSRVTACIPAILLTGYLVAGVHRGNIQRIIRKPFSTFEVVRAILELGVRKKVA